MPESMKAKKARALKIVERLREHYPDAECALDYTTPLELLVATILSAQCTDKRVNIVTKELFKKYRSAEDFAKASQREMEDAVRTTGFYKNKAKNIIGAAQKILSDYGGEVPNKLEELVKLPGAGRKTANVVLGNYFGIPGLTVDTHMTRINRFLKLTNHTDAVKIEYDLMKLIPEKEWTYYSHRVIHHGRARCVARRPDCANCELADLCPSKTIAVKPAKKSQGRHLKKNTARSRV